MLAASLDNGLYAGVRGLPCMQARGKPKMIVAEAPEDPEQETNELQKLQLSLTGEPDKISGMPVKEPLPVLAVTASWCMAELICVGIRTCKGVNMSSCMGLCMQRRAWQGRGCWMAKGGCFQMRTGFSLRGLKGTLCSTVSPYEFI